VISPSISIMSCLPELLLLLGAISVMFLGLFASHPAHKDAADEGALSNKPLSNVYCYRFVQIFLSVSAVALIYLLPSIPIHAFNSYFVIDALAIYLKLIVLIFAVLIFFYTRSYVNKYFSSVIGEYYALHLFALIGAFVLVSARSLLPLFLGLELFSLPLYALVGLRHDCNRATEAALKYFVLGAFATGILLYGFSLLYGITHSLTFSGITQSLFMLGDVALPIGRIALGMVLLGLAFKLGVIPCHMWVPDVYEGAPTSVVMFIASIGKIIAFALLFRLLGQVLPGFSIQWQYALVVFSLISITVGNLGALFQITFKRLLGYSSIAHMGYLLLGVLSATRMGYGFALFYVITYAFVTLAGFAVLTFMEMEHEHADKLTYFIGLNRRRPELAFFLLVVMFSLASVPPLVGFIAKVGVLWALIRAHFTPVAVVAMLLAAVGVYYSIRVVKLMYFDAPVDSVSVSEAAVGRNHYTLQNKVVLCGLTLHCILVLGIGVFPSRLLAFCQSLF